MFVLHLVLSWSRFLSWVLFLADLGLIGYLTMRAYRDGKLSLQAFLRNEADLSMIADTLDRCEVPYIGRIASNILDDE